MVVPLARQHAIDRGMLLKMSDGEPKYDAETEAAIIWAGLEVVDLTYLFDSGRGYMRPGDTGPYLRGTMCWSFMSDRKTHV